MSDKQQTISLLSDVAASLELAAENVGKIRKPDGVVENLDERKQAVIVAIESAGARLAELQELVSKLEDPGTSPVEPVTAAADRQAVGRLRRGERLQLVSRGDGRWQIDFRTPSGGVVLGEEVSAIHLALSAAEIKNGFPQLPDQGEPLSDSEADALARFAAVGRGFECNVRWEDNGTHSKHNFGGAEVRREWTGERGLIVEPVEWLEQEKAGATGGGNGPEPSPDLEAAWSALQNAQPGTQIARVKPNDTRYNGGPFIFEDNKDRVIGEGGSASDAFHEYLAKGGQRAGAPSTLSQLDLEQVTWFSQLGNVEAPTSVRKSGAGVVCDYFRSQGQAGPELHGATASRSSVGQAIQELRRKLGPRI